MDHLYHTKDVKKRFPIWQTLIFILLTGAMLYIAFIVSIVALLSAHKGLMITAVLFLLIGIPLLFISLFIKRISRKNKGISWLIGILIIILPTVAQWGYKIYDDSFIRFNESGVELRNYQPFIAGNKAVTLNEPSTLKFADEYLPKLDGARALYPVYAAFGQAVYPERDYDFDSEIGYHNTIKAYEKLINRQVDIIFVAAPSEGQRALAEDNQVEMKFTPIGKEAFVFFVNAKNPVDGLNSWAIREIYSGKIINWKQVGGKNQSIHAFQRNEGSGSQTALIGFMKGVPIMTPIKDEMATGMGGIVESTADYANYSGAIGFSFRYFTQTLSANDEIKLLKVDGVYPSQETIRSGDYPLTSEFYAVTLADNPEPNVQKLLDWILSPQGQYLIEQTGYVGIGQP